MLNTILNHLNSCFCSSCIFSFKHPLINPKTFLGDAVFDSCQLYSGLLADNTFRKDKYFSKAYIPLNSRSGITNPDCKINENGIRCFPKDDFIPMKYLRTLIILFIIF